MAEHVDLQEQRKKFAPLLKAAASKNKSVALRAQMELAKALELPLRQGVLSGDILGNIFEVIQLEENATAEWPLDLLAPGTEDDFVAYVVPMAGRIPERHVEGDYVNVPLYEIANSIDTHRKYARYARWDVLSRMEQILRAGFTKKMNDDGWHTLISAGVDRNIIVFDNNAAQGQFTKRLVSLCKVVMRRNGGGNSTSVNRRKLTDLFTSPENVEDMRNWNVDQVDEVTRREIFVAEDGRLNRIFSVNLHDLDELGVGQEYQRFFTEQLSGVLPTGDVEVSVGLDLSGGNTSFVMPTREQLEIVPADDLLRQRRLGWWGTMELGFGVLDTRRVILLSN